MMKVEGDDGGRPPNKHPPMMPSSMDGDEFTIETKGSTASNGYQPSPSGGSDSSSHGGPSSIDSGVGVGAPPPTSSNNGSSPYTSTASPMEILSAPHQGFSFGDNPGYSFQPQSNDGGAMNQLQMMATYSSAALDTNIPPQQQYYYPPTSSDGNSYGSPSSMPGITSTSGGSTPGTIKVASNLMPSGPSHYDAPFQPPHQLPMESEVNQQMPQLSVTMPMPYPISQQQVQQPPTYVTAGASPMSSPMSTMSPGTFKPEGPTKPMLGPSGRPLMRRMMGGRGPGGAMRGGPVRGMRGRGMPPRGIIRRPMMAPSPSSSVADDDIEIISENVTHSGGDSGGGARGGMHRTPEKPRGAPPVRRSPSGRLMRPVLRARGGLGRGAPPPGSSSIPSTLQSRGLVVSTNRRPEFASGIGIKRKIESDGPVSCQLCDKVLSNKQELQDHIVTLHAGGQEPFQALAFNLHNINHIEHLARIGVKQVIVDKTGRRALPVFNLSDVRSGVSFEGITGLQTLTLS